MLQLQPVPGLLVPGESDPCLGLVLGVHVVVGLVLGVTVGAGLGVDVGEQNVYDNDDSECHVIFILFLVSMFVRSF